MTKLVVKKKETKILDEYGISKFYVYNLPFNKSSMGVSEINGRYPTIGFDVDTKVEGLWYVESGSGEIFLQNKIHKIQSGAMILVPKGEKFWILGKKLKLIVVSSPPWHPEQHKNIK